MLDRHADPSSPLAVCGDFNIAPDDRDVYDPAEFVDATHTSEPEREALARLEEWGLEDVFRRHYDAGGLFSWWDYRAGNFHKGKGMRIDLDPGVGPAGRALGQRPDRPQRPQGQVSPATTRRWWPTSTSDRRRTRAGRHGWADDHEHRRP